MKYIIMCVLALWSLHNCALEPQQSSAGIKVQNQTYNLSSTDIPRLKQDALNGNKYSSFSLANYYRLIALDETESLKWMKLASNQGHEIAQYNYAMIILATNGGYEEGLKLLKASAEHGNSLAAYNYGLELIDNKRQADEGLEWIVKSADKSEELALLYLCEYYLVTEPKIKYAIYWVNRYTVLQISQERNLLSLVSDINGRDILFRPALPPEKYKAYETIFKIHYAYELLLNKPTFRKGMIILKKEYKNDAYAEKIYNIIVRTKYTP